MPLEVSITTSLLMAPSLALSGVLSSYYSYPLFLILSDKLPRPLPGMLPPVTSTLSLVFTVSFPRIFPAVLPDIL